MIEENIRSYTTSFFNETDISLDDFIKHYNNNAKEYHIIPLDVKIT